MFRVREGAQKGLGESQRRIHKWGGKQRDMDIGGDDKWWRIESRVSTQRILYHKMMMRVLFFSYLNEAL